MMAVIISDCSAALGGGLVVNWPTNLFISIICKL